VRKEYNREIEAILNSGDDIYIILAKIRELVKD
jgi:hypothetical protein